MASGAFLGAWLVKQDRLVHYHPLLFVAGFATNPLVGAFQRERGSPFMIEQGRLPPGRVVAIGAECNPVGLGELRPVNVLMALFAFDGCRLEVRIDQLGLHVWRFVAIDAGGSPMCAQQREGRLGMIKALQIFPRIGRVTRLTTRRLPIRSHLFHGLVELALMRVLMAHRARAVVEAINYRVLGLRS